MAKWVTEKLEELLHQINEVPFTDDRDKKQLSILMNGFMQLNNQAMDNAAVKTKSQLRNWDLASSIKAKQEEKAVKEDKADEELTRLRPIK
ncbi:hypothetical protein FLL45_07545 [Aliikangiella marina]|uniref:Uncharacterized protein n=1 Tax=Aliikangiella marina TaxID=1712262 RepID=A0A545TC93_9GAMM|nr:hypothetical protein [Aliikangiella marina]TQV74806.1 hypothetical protein FLL45_07545 [Aliikangiella marina]